MSKPMDVDNVPANVFRTRQWWDSPYVMGPVAFGTALSLFGFLVGALNFQNGIIDAQLLPWYQQGNAVHRLLSRDDE